MRLVSARIRKFKCIDDTTDFSVDPLVTCLVGKNESGKTAVLEALTKVNAADEEDEDFDLDIDYPKKEFGRRIPEAGVSTEWELDLTDMVALGLASTPASGRPVRVTIEKHYDNEPSWTFNLTPGQMVEIAISQSELDAATKTELLKSEDVDALLVAARAIPTNEEGRDEFVKLVESEGFMEAIHAACRKALEPELPSFAFFTAYNELPGRVSVEDFNKRKANGTLRKSDLTFKAFLDAADVDLDSVVATNTYERLSNRLEAFSASISDTIFRYWSQNRHLRVDVRCEAGRGGDDVPFNTGWVIHIRIRNTRQDVTTKFDERSSGFVWFFSFLVWFDRFAKREGGRFVVLLDEPGLTLHARAQRDLLRYFESELAPKYQLIYTTHSPFMIDPEHLLRSRTVDYVIEKVKDEEKDLGTRIGSDVLSTDRDTVFPLQACLGLDITQTLFVGANSLLVEGPSDLLYIKWFQRRLAAAGRTSLDPRWTLVPCGSVDKIETFASLFGASAIRIAGLVDYKHGDKQKVEKLKASRKVDPKALLLVSEFAEKPEADIEDVIGDQTYVDLVSQAYELRTPLSLTPSSKRIEPRVMEAFALLPPTVAEYNHYRPAEFLNGSSRLALVGLAEAENRFEKMFAAFNALLPEA